MLHKKRNDKILSYGKILSQNKEPINKNVQNNKNIQDIKKIKRKLHKIGRGKEELTNCVLLYTMIHGFQMYAIIHEF